MNIDKVTIQILNFDTNTKDIYQDIWDEIVLKFNIDLTQDLFCYIQTPYWQKNNRLVMYNGIAKFFSKKLHTPMLDFIETKYVIENNYVLFGGLIKINRENIGIISNILATYKNGVIFQKNMKKTVNLYYCLTHCNITNQKSLTSTVSIPKLINFLESKYIFLPFSWEETGEYGVNVVISK